jgi:type II secretory ATPase GspE/PulE/Tfp pilus assembly ATPase PilB-like protein
LAAADYGPYISPWKTLAVVVVLLIWARLLTWVDKDAEAAHMPRQAINTGLLSGLALAFILLLFIPGFMVAFAAFLVIFAAEIGVYLFMRNQKVGLGDLSKQFKDWVHSLTSREKEVKTQAGEVMLISKKGTPFPPPEAESPDSAGYNAAQMLLTEPLRRGAERIEMRPTDAAASVRYWVDGVPIDGRSIPKEDAAASVTLLKTLAAMDLNDRRKPQQGTMKTALDGKKRELQVNTAGSTAGETVSIEVEIKKRYDLNLDQLGMTEDQLQLLEEVIGDGQGIVLLTAPKTHGLTALMYAVLRRHDAFLSHIQTVERDPQLDLEGITQNRLPAGAAASEESKQVEWVCSQEPDVVMIDKIEDPRTALSLIKFAEAGHRAYIGMRAGSTFEALQTWRTLVGDDKQAMKHLKLIVAGRLVRRLCNACKMDYNPDPETLKKLNMPPERVGKLFTARTTPLRDPKGREMVCDFCLDLRFRGRVGVFEMFQIDDDVRQVVQAGGSINQLKMLFKKQRQRYLQEAALARAVAGDTSLQEVARVLRAGEGGGTSGSGGGGGGSPSKTPRPSSGSSERRRVPTKGA